MWFFLGLYWKEEKVQNKHEAWWVIPCQTTGKKLEPQKNGILVLISFTYIQKCQIRSFISVVLELVCHFDQILSFEGFDIFLTNMFIFFSKKDLLPILFDQWPKIDPFLKFLAIFRRIYRNFQIFGHFGYFQFFGSNNYAPTQNLTSFYKNTDITCNSYQKNFWRALCILRWILG